MLLACGHHARPMTNRRGACGRFCRFDGMRLVIRQENRQLRQRSDLPRKPVACGSIAIPCHHGGSGPRRKRGSRGELWVLDEFDQQSVGQQQKSDRPVLEGRSRFWRRDDPSSGGHQSFGRARNVATGKGVMIDLDPPFQVGVDRRTFIDRLQKLDAHRAKRQEQGANAVELIVPDGPFGAEAKQFVLAAVFGQIARGHSVMMKPQIVEHDASINPFPPRDRDAPPDRDELGRLQRRDGHVELAFNRHRHVRPRGCRTQPVAPRVSVRRPTKILDSQSVTGRSQ